MNNMDLSILIPARNEMFLNHTINDLFKNIRANTEVIVVLDGAWPPAEYGGVPSYTNLTVVKLPESIGQRAATNLACRIAKGKYVMKVDAHCAFDEGFDVKMIEKFKQEGDDVTMVPIMKNLHVFNWVCTEGHTRYQGRSGECDKCGNPTTRNMIWEAKKSPNSTSYRFTPEPKFQYFNEYKNREEYTTMRDSRGVTETMSLQGSCFMLTRERYWELDISEESWGSWGSQGIEVACKTWLSGGRVLCNHDTWYAHLFRTQGGDFGWPFPMHQSDIDTTKAKAREYFFEGKWDKQTKPLGWLLEKFWPVPDWTPEEVRGVGGNKVEPSKENTRGHIKAKKPSKGVIYYTDGRLESSNFGQIVRDQILKGIKEKHIISATLAPLNFGKNIVLDKYKPGILTMFRQILAALESSTADVIFFCEHDVLYHPKHFDFLPLRSDVFYYNTNVWKVRAEDGFAWRVDDMKQVSGLVANRELLVGHYRRRIAKILRNQADFIERGESYKNDGYSRHMGFEPGTHRYPRGVDEYEVASYESLYPNLDIRHDKNLTPSKWKPEDFRDPKYAEGWRECALRDGTIKGWEDFLKEGLDKHRQD